MKMRDILLGILLIGFVLMSGCVENFEKITTTLKEFTKEDITALISTDKKTYHSDELMNITVEINSPVYLRDVRIKVYGINAGRYRLNEEEFLTLYPREQEIVSFPYRTPRCYGCAGISPGEYRITMEISHEDEILKNKTIGVEIRE